MSAPSSQQRSIIEELGVQPTISAAREIERRSEFLRTAMERTGRRALVLGISGGLDSTVAGRLAARAAEASRGNGNAARMIALRLPYGEQRDEDDAQQALGFIKPDVRMHVDIQPGTDALLASIEEGGLGFNDEGHRDFVLGNIKARLRMSISYAVAGAEDGLVVGTGQAAETLMGFFTKYGDEACDIAPLQGLTKRQTRELAAALGAPARLVDKVPTADLETLSPMRPDEEALGVSYDAIDDFLEGGDVAEDAVRAILKAYEANRHKRSPPMSPL